MTELEVLRLMAEMFSLHVWNEVSVGGGRQVIEDPNWRRHREELVLFVNQQLYKEGSAFYLLVDGDKVEVYSRPGGKGG